MLLSHRPSPPSQLDTRADSPMREKARLAGNSSVNRNTVHGLPTPATDVPSSGFTAVNGEAQRTTSFRHDDSARDTGFHATVSAQNQAAYTPHAWRPEESRDAESARQADQLGSPSNKRKRDESDAGEGRRENGRNEPPSALGDRSPKRPMTVLNSGGIQSPEQSNQIRAHSSERDDLEQPSTGTYVREPTPTARTGRTSPPPQARPETVSGLAASLNATLREEQQAQAAAQSSTSPNDGDQSVHFMPALGDPNDNDSKRRKRNFSNRTKTGCHTCRSRKKKCDEAKPICENCRKGGFPCGGYGPKPPGGTNKLGAVRPMVPLQAKQQYEQAQGPAGFYDPTHASHNSTRPPPPQHWPDPHRPEPYGSVPYRYGNQPPVDHRPPSARDGWGPRTSWGPHEQPQAYPPERLPPPDFPPPPHHYPHDHAAPQAPLPGPWVPPQPPGPYNRPTLPPPHQAGPPTVISSHESISTSHSGSHGRRSLGFPLNGPLTERKKMLAGMPYKHFIDDELLADRQSCKRAVASYNEICDPFSTASETEKGAKFIAVYNPRERAPIGGPPGHWMGPIGACDDRVVVEAPFMCEFGYNINLGEHVVIGTNCFMQDAATIYIGSRTIVSPNVKFYCMTASVDASQRNEGCRGNFTAGAIKVEEDCYIGGDVTILPYRTIGKGAVVGAGSVVTRDVKPYTVVAGNPAKLVRKRKIERGAPDVDRHDDAIQEENEKMVELMKADAIVPQSLRDKMRDMMRR